MGEVLMSEVQSSAQTLSPIQRIARALALLFLAWVLFIAAGAMIGDNGRNEFTSASEREGSGGEWVAISSSMKTGRSHVHEPESLADCMDRKNAINRLNRSGEVDDIFTVECVRR
jgi:hypothetical protein